LQLQFAVAVTKICIYKVDVVVVVFLVYYYYYYYYYLQKKSKKSKKSKKKKTIKPKFASKRKKIKTYAWIYI